MDNIEKFLRKLSSKDLSKISSLLLLIQNNKVDALDIKKLKTSDDLFRIRSGNIRIVFRRSFDKNMVIDINYRKDIYK